MKAFLKENDWSKSNALIKLERGWGNGYVALPRRHPYFGLDCNEINEEKLGCYVHGGLTFSRHSSNIGWEEVKDMDDMWIIGWDTRHGGDTIESWPRERVLKENQMLSVHLAKAWSDDIKRQSNEVELFIDELHNNLTQTKQLEQ